MVERGHNREPIPSGDPLGCALSVVRGAAREHDLTTPLLHARDFHGRRGLGHHDRSEEHTSELQSQSNLVCRLLLEKKKKKYRETCEDIMRVLVYEVVND